jgi:cytoskeletal protein CcmA (bactofilin family)
MGRSSRQETSDATDYQGQTPNAETRYPYGTEASPSPSSRVVTDSESMARDIKEGRLSGFVGHGTVLTGDTNFQAMLRVDGQLQGTVSSESGTLIVGSNGQVDANIAVASAMVNGTINGDIVASEKIQLGRTAKVVGNIQAPRLIIEEGATLEGSCSMLRAKEAQEKRETEVKSQYASSQYSGYAAAQDTVDTDADDEEESDDSVITADSEDEETAEAAAL